MANLILNPSFEVDTNADGLADSWTPVKSVAGTVTNSRVAGLFGSYAQRAAYTSTSDSGKMIGLASAVSSAGSIAAGNNLSGGAFVRVVATGSVTLALYVSIRDASIAQIAYSTCSYPAPITDAWIWLPAYFAACPVNSSGASLQVSVLGIDTGDAVTLDVDGVYLSPDANFDHYGKYPVIGGA